MGPVKASEVERSVKIMFDMRKKGQEPQHMLSTAAGGLTDLSVTPHFSLN